MTLYKTIPVNTRYKNLIDFTQLTKLRLSISIVLSSIAGYFLAAEEIAEFETEPLIQKLTQIKNQWPQFVHFLPNLSQSELAAWFNGSGVQRHCLSLWHTLFLRPDSIAVPCGHMQNTELGSVLKKPLEGIWNSNAFKSIRLAQRQEAFQMCGRCCKV